jgi:hypothetical protein
MGVTIRYLSGHFNVYQLFDDDEPQLAGVFPDRLSAEAFAEAASISRSGWISAKRWPEPPSPWRGGRVSQDD